MKKYLSTIVLLLLVFPVFTQNITIVAGKIVDQKSNDPLPHANIIYLKKSLGTISNASGNFSLSLAECNLTDSIIISYVGYLPYKTILGDCIHKSVFQLQADLYVMDEIMVKAEKFKLKPFMKEVIAEYNKSRRETAHIAIAHYREKAGYKDKYFMYKESIGYSIYSGNPGNNSPLSNYNFYCENSKFSFSDSLWMYTRSNSQGLQHYDLPPSAWQNLNTFRVFEVKGLLSNKYCNKYKFQLDSSYFINQEEVLCIKFSGDGDQGTIDVFNSNKKILKVECSTGKLWVQKFGKRIRADFKFAFVYFGETPFVRSVNSSYKKDGIAHSTSISILLQKFKKFNLDELDSYWSMQSYNNNPFIFYQSDEWSKYTIAPEADIDVIVNDLSTSDFSLEEQFMQRSGKWFVRETKQGILAKQILNELKRNF